ncbi:putative Proteasome assembly chaperone 2, partial [Daphnia magna]
MVMSSTILSSSSLQSIISENICAKKINRCTSTFVISSNIFIWTHSLITQQSDPLKGPVHVIAKDCSYIKMRVTLSTFVLICLVAAIHFQPSRSHLPPIFKDKLLGKGHNGKDAGGTALAAVISSRKFGLGIKAVLLKPLLLVALAKIKFALLLGKPLALLAIKKLLLKAVLGKLLLKIPLILLKGKALLVKMLALKFALVTKGLLGLKAPLAMLFLGACALGSGLGLALALGATLHKLKEGSYEENYSYEQPYYPPPRPSYGAPPAYSSPSS